jgi:hypothetical protein
MKRNTILLVVVFSLILSSFACSILGGKDADNGDTGAVPTEAPEFEEATIDKESIWNTMDIKSYRGDFTMTFDGTKEGEVVNGSVTMNIEVTSEPSAQHMSMGMEGYDMDPELAGFDRFEFYLVEDTVYMNLGLEDGWIALPNDPDDSVSDEFMSYQDFVDLPDKAKRKLLPENVNGVMAWHYVIDEDDLEELGTYDEITADVWIAVDGGYVVKMDFTMSGSFTAEDLGDQPIDEGTMHIIFNMHDVNSDFTIELPPEAAAAEPFSFDEDLFGGGEWDREDVPLPEDAEVDFAMEGMVSANTNLSFDDALAFMLTQLEANGWVIEGEPWASENSYMGDFTKEGESLNLMVDPAYDDSGRISITITIN